MLALPMKNGGSFHSYVTVYQRVSPFSIDILLIKFATIDTNYPKNKVGGYITLPLSLRIPIILKVTIYHQQSPLLTINHY